MTTFTANKQGLSFIRGQKLVSVLSLILFLFMYGSQIYFAYITKNKIDGPHPLLSFPFRFGLSTLLIVGWAYFYLILLPNKCNRFIQSIEYDDGRIKLKTFPFKTIIPLRNLKAIEFTSEGNKLEIGKSSRWDRIYGREQFIILHEGKKYCLVPYFFDDFYSMIQTIPFVKVEAMA